MNYKCYSELITLNTWVERLEYLRTFSDIGSVTFGSDRYINQRLYSSPRWKSVRRKVILRDEGLDLGIPERLIYDRLTVHHINPITIEQIVDDDPLVYSMENLITCSSDTHELIHFSTYIPEQEIIERKENDTSPWVIDDG